jgi:4-nitrophenyl phosphatase
MSSPLKFDKSKLRGLILDMDGVLWRGTAPLGNLPAIFKKITASGWRVIMATNNASRSPQQYVDTLSGFGVTVDPWQVINSGLVTAHYLKERHPKGGNVFVVGEESLVEILRNAGFPPGKDPVAVVVALDRGLTYQKLTEAALLIRSGIPFIGTNPDISFPIPEGQAPGAGAILAALETTTGVSPTIMGKPQLEMYKVALERLKTSPETTLVVGDRLETDILGAQKMGCPSGLVLSGVTSLEAARKWQPAPDIIADDLTQLMAIVTGER